MNDRIVSDLRSLATKAVRRHGEGRIRDLRAHAEMDVFRAIRNMRPAPERTAGRDRSSAKVGGEAK